MLLIVLCTILYQSIHPFIHPSTYIKWELYVWVHSSRQLYANDQNDKGNPYPIWATDLSYEAILYLSSGRKDNMTVLTNVGGQVGVPQPTYHQK